jgi:hypothetical protein
MSAIDPPDPNLTALALLYAHGELDGAEVAAFEQRLGEDQSAREALCQAVQLSQTVGGQLPPTPDPAYRERVRLGLSGRPVPPRPRSWWHALLRPRSYPGHPSAWLAAGAVAATLLVLGGQAVLAPPAGSPVAPEAQVWPAPEPTAPPPDDTAEMARIWATLHNPDHLERVRADEQRRKQRHEDRRLVHHDKHGGRGSTPLAP